MRNTVFVKGLTLCCFAGLICLFLFYRSGMLDNYLYGSGASLQTSPNGGALNTKQDSSKRKQDSTRRVRASSSKSMIVTDDVHMYSSKSGRVFTPRSEKDSIKADSVKQQKK
jgi:hypothetical protein